jgi:hypothetical protein
MKLRARVDILLEKRYKAGEIVETNEETGLVLIKQAWAEEIVEKKPAAKPAEAETKKRSRKRSE